MAAINHPYGGARRPFGRILPRLPAPNWWILGALAILGFGAVLPVIQNSTATTRGFEIQALQAEQSRLQGEIRAYEADVATHTSLARVEQRAVELGLKPAEDPIWVEVDEAGPAPAKIPADHLPPPSPQTGDGESWWQSLFGALPLLPGQ